MSEKVPNVPVVALVPATFPGIARRLGYTAEEMLWLLAADLGARRPASIKVTTQKAKGGQPRALPSNVVPFPGREEAA